jgi:hypothetical protein
VAQVYTQTRGSHDFPFLSCTCALLIKRDVRSGQIWQNWGPEGAILLNKTHAAVEAQLHVVHFCAILIFETDIRYYICKVPGSKLKRTPTILAAGFVGLVSSASVAIVSSLTPRPKYCFTDSIA